MWFYLSLKFGFCGWQVCVCTNTWSLNTQYTHIPTITVQSLFWVICFINDFICFINDFICMGAYCM